jgi:hypothetical protein
VTPEPLRRIGDADELQITSRRTDGTLRPYVTIWAARAADAIYVRSAYGARNPWFTRAVASGTGRVRAGGAEHDVTFTRIENDSPIHERIDEAYHAKYDRYGAAIVGSVVGPGVRDVTLLVQP